MPSIVIAAHNEELVIGATLDALLAQQLDGPLDIIVSVNGCTDGTAAAAARPGVLVIDRPEPGKPGALNAADTVARTFPRIYLDADIVVPPDGVAQLVASLNSAAAPLAAVPRRKLNAQGRPWLVRAYSAISERHPAFRTGLFGRGMIALSAEGRARFGSFPSMIADDLFLDSQFSNNEKVVTAGVEVTVEAPFTTRDLLRRLVRVRRGNAQMRAAAAMGEIAIEVRPADRWAWLKDVVVREPHLALAVVPYLGLSVLAALLARLPARSGAEWGRDEKTRRGADPGRGAA